MNKNLHHIQQKIGSIQLGLLHIRDERTKTTFRVKTSANNDNSLNCVVTEGFPKRRLIHKNVNLVQRSHNDYLYITGQISNEVNKKGKILSIRILKACWFVRRSRGNISWLEEKYMYENFRKEKMDIAS